MITKEQYDKIREDRGKIATQQQRFAANPKLSVWVEASAGTGKTKVLSDRVLRLLLNGVKPIKLLCLTYTKAAAVEMKTRIAERLSKWSVIPDEKLEENLYELLGKDIKNKDILEKYKNISRTLFATLLDTPGGIKIQTIHSFCQETLKRFPLEAGISPYFEVMEDSASNDILLKTKKEILDEAEKYTETQTSKSLQYLTSNLSEFTFSKIMKVIINNRSKISDMLNKYSSFDEYCKDLAKVLKLNPTINEKDLIEDFFLKIDETDIYKIIEAWSHGTENEKERSYRLSVFMQSNLKIEQYADYKSFFLTKKDTVMADKNLATKSVLSFSPQILDTIKSEAFRIIELENTLKNLRLYKSTIAVLQIAKEFIDKYLKYKQEYSKLDFEDLILLTRNLLSNESVALWVLYKLDGGIDHILLDEAQDTSPNQWEIIKSISSEFFTDSVENKRTIFVVGDRKQSIYSFQGADPDKFDIMSDYFAQKGGNNFNKINLSVSFRSSSAVLDTVNKLYENPTVSSGVVAPDEVVKHLPFRAGEYGKVEIWPLLVAPKKEEDTKYWLPPIERNTEISTKTKLARMVAEKIKLLRQESLSSSTPLNYRDFMVLVQKRASFVDEFVRACKEIGVNISGADKLKLSDQIVVHDLISLGKFLLLPNDDLSLAEILKSPLFGLTDDDLLQLCYNRGKAPLWTKLGDNKAYKEVYEKLKTLLNMVDYTRPYELFNYVLSNMKGRYLYSERMGIEVEDSLDEFINLTISYEREHIPSMQGFIDWIIRSEVEIKREMDQKDNDAVRLMTVHGSKGLQAPIVFLPDTVSVKNAEKGQGLLWDNDIAYYPLNSDCYTERCCQIKDGEQTKLMEEYRRLLYVALTRAEDKLYICGYSNKTEVNNNSWYSLCRSCLEDIGVASNDIIVNEEPEIISKKYDNKKVNKEEECPFEKWIYNDVAIEEKLAKPYTPSKMIDDEEDSISPLTEQGHFYRRGTLIHKLFQFLPQNITNYEFLIDEFLNKNAPDFNLNQINQIKKEILSALNKEEFKEIFGANSKAEVSIMGEVDGKIISAQIDRLVILPDKIMIIDFKTNRPAAKQIEDTPEVYINQLRIYTSLLNRIYPNLPVEAYILWTNETRLMQVC